MQNGGGSMGEKKPKLTSVILSTKDKFKKKIF